jgi:hypothetical protein
MLKGILLVNMGAAMETGFLVEPEKLVRDANPAFELVFDGGGGYTVVPKPVNEWTSEELTQPDLFVGFDSGLVAVERDSEAAKSLLDQANKAGQFGVKFLAFRNPEDLLAPESEELVYYVFCSSLAQSKSESGPYSRKEYGFKYIKGSVQKSEDPYRSYYCWEAELTKEQLEKFLEYENITRDYSYDGEQGGIMGGDVGWMQAVCFSGDDDSYSLTCYPKGLPALGTRCREEGKMLDYDYSHFEPFMAWVGELVEKKKVEMEESLAKLRSERGL